MQQHPPDVSLALRLHAEAITSGLQDRSIASLVRLPGRNWRAILLIDGELTVEYPDRTVPLPAPVVALAPWQADMRLIARAGSVGHQVLLSEPALTNAIGHKPESTELRQLAERLRVVPLGQTPSDAAELAQIFRAVHREAQQDARGAEMAIEALLRIVLVFVWRQSQMPDMQGAQPSAAIRLLTDFRQLMEAHFRDRWSVNRYAEALGVTPDRLHDVCTRTLSRSPKQLVQDRLIFEAQILLERSSRSIDQISHDLGFPGPTNFSRAFKAGTGTPPGAYRKTHLQSVRGAPFVPDRTFADWP